MLKLIILGICIVTIMFFFDVLLPKIKLKYKLYKEIKAIKEIPRTFKNKIRELETI